VPFRGRGLFNPIIHKRVPVVAQFAAQLADAPGRQSEPLRNDRRRFPRREQQRDATVPVRERRQPRGEIQARRRGLSRREPPVLDQDLPPLLGLIVPTDQARDGDARLDSTVMRRDVAAIEAPPDAPPGAIPADAEFGKRRGERAMPLSLGALYRPRGGALKPAS
jgi:hypothetical protein